VSSGVEQPWWEEDPARLEQEFAYLREIAPIVKKTEDDGNLVLEITLQHRGEDLPVTVVFSQDHPFVPPALKAKPGVIERHQNPVNGRFCVIDNEEHWWQPSMMTAAMVEQLQLLLAASSAGTVEEGEFAMPEPVTGYLSGAAEEIVIVHDLMLTQNLDAEDGEFELIRFSDSGYLVAEIDGVQPKPVHSPGRSPTERGARGHWKVVNPPPGPSDLGAMHEDAFHELASEAAPLQRRAGRGRRNRRGMTLWTARTFLEEGPRRGEQRRAWVFYKAILEKLGGVAEQRCVLTQGYGKSVRSERIPELDGLGKCRVVVIGAGALGAPVVGELAKAGCGHIDVIDHDRYDLNNSVRHVLPTRSAARFKATAVTSWAQGLNPFVTIEPHCFRVGAEQRGVLRGLVEAANVVVDTTGFHYVTRLLHRESSDAGTSLVSGALSLGGYGGRVLILRDARPCFDCFLENETIPLPLEEPKRDEEVTPYGCSHPAASCAGFDAAEFAAIVARTAVRATGKTDYPALDFDWAVVNFRPGAERWQQGQLSPAADCSWCGR
jgi:molybdopterin/thiamine biosynthesis adenylyltransferase